MNRITLLILLIPLVVFKSFSQNPKYLKWSKFYGGSQDDNLIQILKNQDGFLLAGNTLSNDGDVTVNYGMDDIWIVQTDSIGNIIWQNSYGDTLSERFVDIIETEDNGYIITIHKDFDNGNSIMKIDYKGDVIWEKTLTTTKSPSQKFYLEKTTNNHYLVAGTIEGRFYLSKIDESGHVLWDKYYGETNNYSNLNDIVATNDSGFLLGGFNVIGEGENANINFSVVKIDSLGSLLWQKTYGGSEDDELITMNVSSNNEILIGGHTYSNDGDISSGNKGRQDIWLVKTDVNGNILWEKTVGGSNNDYISSINNFDNQDYIIGAYTESIDGDFESEFQGYTDYKILNIGSSGEINWYRSFGGYFWDFLHSIYILENGDILAGGVGGSPLNYLDTISGNHGYADFWLIKLGDNTPPTDILLSDSTVKENSDIVLVGSLTTIDEDIDDLYEYEIISDDEEIRNTFNIIGRYLFAETENLDYHSRNNYLVTIQTKDREANTFRKQFNIKVINEFDLDYVILRHPSCPDYKNGSIEVGLKGFVPPLTLNWYRYDTIWIPIGDTTLLIDNLSPGLYMVEATDSTGGTMQFQFTLNQGTPFEGTSLCYITSNSRYNEIHIDKGLGNYNVEKYLIYREGISENNYEKIGEINPLENYFIDSLVNNRTQSFSYKVSLLDSCGNESNLSSNHNTIHLSQNRGTSGEVNLYWTPYVGLDVPTYSIYRQKENEEFELLTQISSNNNTYTDFTSNPSFNYQYYISFQVEDVCYTDVNLKSDEIIEVKSNIVSTDVNYTDVLEIENTSIKIYPNPVNDKLIVENPNSHKLLINIYDLIGTKILEKESTDYYTEIDFRTKTNGVYLIEVTDSNGNQHMNKIIKN
ncbi:MAG: T9SS type A sorting domain-containing protein [Candidatus Thermoplasmatota archaeon]|nr:T9SS type A sorting domain-containing protein [Candidatus Thermoplasmatota archaeon]